MNESCKCHLQRVERAFSQRRPARMGFPPERDRHCDVRRCLYLQWPLLLLLLLLCVLSISNFEITMSTTTEGLGK